MGVLREGVGVYRGGASVAHHIFLGKLVMQNLLGGRFVIRN